MTAKGHGRRASMPICRVCRQGQTDNNQPLFYPCQCSGSIKYVHQECLVQWLKMSKKTYCELCKHKFSFTPIYRQGTPTRMPVRDQLAMLLRYSVRGLASSARVFSIVAMVLTFCLLYMGAMPIALGFLVDRFLIGGLQWDKTEERVAMWWYAGLLALAMTAPFSLGMALLQRRIRSYIAETLARPDSSKLKKMMESRRKRPRDSLVRSGVATLDSSGDQPPLDSLTDAMPVTPSLMTDGIRPAIISRRRVERKDMPDNQSEAGSVASTRWIDNVTNREYRAYLKRREMVRQRERAQYESHLLDQDVDSYHPSPCPSTQGDAEDKWEDEHDSKAAAADDESMSVMSGISWLSKQSGALRRRRPIAPAAPAPADANSYRCRVCQGKYCLNREHVVASSKPDFRENQQEVHKEPVAIADSSPATVPTNDRDMDWTYELQVEQAQLWQDFRPRELQAGWLSMMWTFGSVFGFALLSLVLLAVGPHALGKAVLSGRLWAVLRGAVNFVFASAIDNVGRFLHAHGVEMVEPAFAAALRSAAYRRHADLAAGIAVGHALLYAVSTVLSVETMAKVPQRVRTWALWLRTTERVTFWLALQWLAIPTAIGTLLFNQLSQLLPGPLRALMQAELGWQLWALLALAVGLGISIMQDELVRGLRKHVRPGLLFILNDVVSKDAASMTELMVLPAMHALYDGPLENASRLLWCLMCRVVLFETGALPALRLASTYGRPILDAWVSSIGIEEAERTILRTLNHVFFQYFRYGVGGVPVDTLARHVLAGGIRRLAQWLHIRAFLHGGRYPSEERRHDASSPSHGDLARWHFCPDDDRRTYTARKTWRMWRRGRVQPVDIAKLPVYADTPDSDAGSMGMSRFRGYNVVYCAPGLVAKLGVLLAYGAVCTNAWLLWGVGSPWVLGLLARPITAAVAFVLCPWVKADGAPLVPRDELERSMQTVVLWLGILLVGIIGRRLGSGGDDAGQSSSGRRSARAYLSTALMWALTLGPLSMTAGLWWMMLARSLMASGGRVESGVGQLAPWHQLVTVSTWLWMIGAVVVGSALLLADQVREANATLAGSSLLVRLQRLAMSLRAKSYDDDGLGVWRDGVLAAFLPLQMWLAGHVVMPIAVVMAVKPVLPTEHGRWLAEHGHLLWLGSGLLLAAIRGGLRWHQTTLLPRMHTERYLERLALHNLDATGATRADAKAAPKERAIQDAILATTVLAA